MSENMKRNIAYRSAINTAVSAFVTWTGCAAPSCVAVQERGEGVLAAELRSAAAACSGTSCSTPPVPGGYNEE